MPDSTTPAKRYYEQDGDLSYLTGKKVAIIGYGSQGHAHALNLRDSGIDVVVGLYEGSPSWKKAESAGLKVMTVSDAAKDRRHHDDPGQSDHIQADLYEKDIAPHMTEGQDPDVRARLQHPLRLSSSPPPMSTSPWLPPKPRAIASANFSRKTLASPRWLRSIKTPQAQALEVALAYARALGCLKAGVIETHFKEETESDLFGEQTVLCGGVSPN